MNAPALAALTTLALACGCGEGLCQKAHRIGTRLNNKGAACVTGSTPVEISLCEQTSKKCTQADVDGINRTLDCYEKLGECTPANQQKWISDLRDCQDKLHPGSSVCLAM